MLAITPPPASSPALLAAAASDVEPCRFCRGPGVVDQTRDGQWYAMCADTGCVVFSRTFPDRAQALAAWNGPAASRVTA